MLNTASGGFNTGVGSRSLESNASGINNTAVGSNSIFTNSSGDENTGVGRNSLYLTTGSYNTSLGWYSGNEITSGTYNTVIGHNASASGATAVNQTVIGAEAIGQGDNTVTLGDDAVTKVYASEDAGATLHAAAINLENDETITNSTDGTVSIGGSLSGTGTISGFDANLSDQTATTYTLVAADNGKVVTLNHSSAITLTIPTGLGDGFNCLLVQKGAGQVTIAAASGVTISNRSSETKTAGRYGIVTVVNIGSEAYILAGDTGS